jgi:aryl sulfotransferase
VPIRYRSADEDSARWLGFPFRPGDIVISTRSKSGTTWVQMICALLVFQTSDLPAPLSELSPWLDWLVTPRDEVYARLAAQDHRRFLKTHTPLDGIPLDPRATYVVVARHPLDMAVSLYHQGDNLDRERIRQLTGQAEPDGPPVPRPPLRDWLVSWIDRDVGSREEMDSLPGVMWHLSDAWARRDEPNVTLVHYDDLSADLEDEMRRLASSLDITVPEALWRGLVRGHVRAHEGPCRHGRSRPIGRSQGRCSLLPAGFVGRRQRTAHRRRTGALRDAHGTTGASGPAGLAPPVTTW